jgi:hypothetical protein
MPSGLGAFKMFKNIDSVGLFLERNGLSTRVSRNRLLGGTDQIRPFNTDVSPRNVNGELTACVPRGTDSRYVPAGASRAVKYSTMYALAKH